MTTCTQPRLPLSVPVVLPEIEPRGVTYCPERDRARLCAQGKRVFDAMRGRGWMTLEDIKAITNDPTPSISARIRGMRNRCPSWMVDSRRAPWAGPDDGVWEYRVVLPEEDGWLPPCCRPQRKRGRR